MNKTTVGQVVEFFEKEGDKIRDYKGIAGRSFGQIKAIAEKYNS